MFIGMWEYVAETIVECMMQREERKRQKPQSNK